jgi:hypothetical protein
MSDGLILLNEDQLEILHDVYLKRSRLLRGTAFGFPSIMASTYYLFLMRSHNQLNWISISFYVFFVLLFYAALYYLYRKRVLPIKKDIQQKIGFNLPLQIVRKSAFEPVQRYFLFFDHEKYPNKEVSYEEYLQYPEASFYNLPIAKESKLVLDHFCNFDVL